MKTTFPNAMVVPYGPDDHTVTKIVVTIFNSADDEGVLRRWVKHDIVNDPNITREINEFLKAYGARTVVTVNKVFGCPHEEGKDFPRGDDCPFCPFWKGKQAGENDPRWNNLSVRQQKLVTYNYKFWLP